MAHLTIKKRKKLAKMSKGVKKPKSNSAANKRFSITPSGKVLSTQANKQHNMIKHSSAQKKRQVGVVIAVKHVAYVVKKFFRINKKK